MMCSKYSFLIFLTENKNDSLKKTEKETIRNTQNKKEKLEEYNGKSCINIKTKIA